MLFRRRKRNAPAPELKRSGPRDRLLTLPDAELDIARVVEGCCSHFHGIPLDACPWPRNYPELWQAWRTGWLGASFYRDSFADDDAERWLIQSTNNAGGHQ